MPGNPVGRRFPWRREKPQAPTLPSTMCLHKAMISSSAPTHHLGNSDGKGGRKKIEQAESLKIFLPQESEQYLKEFVNGRTRLSFEWHKTRSFFSPTRKREGERKINKRQKDKTVLCTTELSCELHL